MMVAKRKQRTARPVDSRSDRQLHAAIRNVYEAYGANLGAFLRDATDSQQKAAARLRASQKRAVLPPRDFS